MPKRLLAEWENQSFIQLMFPHKNTHWYRTLDEMIVVFQNIAKIISKYQKCLVCYRYDDNIKNIKNQKNIIFKKVSSNDTWCRDFGAITIKKNKTYKLLNFQFNGWGNKFKHNLDNKINQKIFNNIKNIDFILEGGSIDSNGNNTIITTEKCLLNKNRNKSYSKKQIQKCLHKYLGVKKTIWIKNGYLIGDDTDSHIDMLARFVSKNTLVYIKCTDKNDKHYKELKQMEKELQKTNFKLIPLPWIKPILYKKQRLPASYVNFIILNKAILVPTYKNKSDKKTLKIFKKIFPRKDIIGIDSLKIIRQGGSLHCLTMQYYH